MKPKNLQKQIMKKPITILLAVLLIASCKSNKKVTDLSNKDAQQETATVTEKPIKGEIKEPATPAKKEVSMAERQLTLTNYFNAIANASSTTSANNSINEALALFSTSSAPVLIVIHRDGDVVDYDKPTVIKDYLNYLKDQKKNINRIETMELDSNGKIKSLELIRSK
ncbi:nucleoid-structuring protein H-NS [Fulvivirga lutimaris]|nr:nucleoid-structuring protein H-NS [Fulvivirga lutimaris]